MRLNRGTLGLVLRSLNAFALKLVLLLCVGVVPTASAEVLVSSGSVWRWRPGTNEASAPVAAWRTPEFNDAQFASAPAPFWYGDVLPGGTQIRGMQNVYGSIFLRRTFDVPDVSKVGGLILRALVDDGFVAWINGVEVARVRVPGAVGEVVSVATLAENAPEPVSWVEYPLAGAREFLRSGANVLAVQVFQSSLGSSDLGFDASLESFVPDTTAPKLTRVEPESGTSVGALTTVTLTFSEPVTGVVAAHLLINDVGARSVTSLSPTTYVFEFPQPAYGPVTVRWDSRQTIVDLADPANRFDPSSSGAGSLVFTLEDRTAPFVFGRLPAEGGVARTLESVTVIFSESVTGVDAADFRINGVPATAVVNVGDLQYQFQFPQPALGRVTFDWAPDAGIEDRAIPANRFRGGSWSVVLDPDAVVAPPYISEFLASNTRSLRDESGQYSDWIELYNPSEASLDLGGWALTDNAEDLTKWRFPSTNLPPGGFLVVFASGADRRVSGARLHTNFQLSSGGEYLALARPDGRTIVSEYRPRYLRQAPDVSFGVVQTPRGNFWDRGVSDVYFSQSTPGAPNVGGAAIPGPTIEELQHAPRVPSAGETLQVTARVRSVFQPVASVTLRYRVMFGAEVSLSMLDDGVHGDGGAGDGVYGAAIPAGVAAPGQMIRYRVVAADLQGASSRWPLFPSPTTSPEYQGTVVKGVDLTTRLPVFELFVASNQLAGIDSESGGRVSLFHDGELYDNVYMELRGNTSAGLNKKSHRLEFNRGFELRHPGPGGRVRKTALLAEYLDPAYLRQGLCFWFLDQIGVPSPFHYPVRVQMNGQFYQLAFHSDVIGQEQIERMGYDPRGALYKAVGNLTPNFSSTGVFQKLEPDNDPSRADYLQLANGINESASIATRRAAVFDLLDVPQVINHLAGTRWCAENDDVWANMSLYRDTHGDGLWRNIPFDMNASWGQLYGGSNPLEATVDASKSHPLYGGSSTGGNYNRLYDVMVRLPETRQMLLRRQRSILDALVQPPGTPFEQRILEARIVALTNQMAPEALLDRAKWGASPWAANKTFAAGVGDLINQFIEPRRRHWYVTHCITNTAKAIGINNSNNAGIPLSQPDDVSPELLDVEFRPLSGNQSQEFVALTNRTGLALDLSGWRISGAVEFQFQPGTVMPSNSVVYVSPNVREFRARSVGPRGGQGLFVVGPYSGQLSARGETVLLMNPRGVVTDRLAYAGNPSPAQRWLRVTEIQYHPAETVGGDGGGEALEFIELKNISSTETLELAGVRFVNGVEFDFSFSAVKRLGPGERVVVAANALAFRSRYGPQAWVAGEYLGQLDNGGERLRLLDAQGEEILDFAYDEWIASTDGGGNSLEVVDEFAEPDAWGQRAQWRASARLGGSPGFGGDGAGVSVSVEKVSDGVLLRFVADANRAYELRAAEFLAEGEWKLVERFSAAASTRTIERVVTPTGPQRLYRIVGVP